MGVHVRVGATTNIIYPGGIVKKWAIRGAGLFVAVAGYNIGTNVAAKILGVAR